MRKCKETTKTKLVFDLLVGLDDFATASQLTKALKGQATLHQAFSALATLRDYKAVDSVVSGGSLWWYATPQCDTRLRVVDERTVESRPRKSRKPAADHKTTTERRLADQPKSGV
jgi:Fe2+ or Zn2+ uptake regulation protein